MRVVLSHEQIEALKPRLKGTRFLMHTGKNPWPVTHHDLGTMMSEDGFGYTAVTQTLQYIEAGGVPEVHETECPNCKGYGLTYNEKAEQAEDMFPTCLHCMGKKRRYVLKPVGVV